MVLANIAQLFVVVVQHLHVNDRVMADILKDEES